MANVDLFNAAVAGMIIGWWLRDISRAARALMAALTRDAKGEVK